MRWNSKSRKTSRSTERATVRKAARKGVKLAFDDFGTGYAS
jgi:EAL domain-containing protein (putative c-di-GMP-specific phosphodiesterase class I)